MTYNEFLKLLEPNKSPLSPFKSPFLEVKHMGGVPTNPTQATEPALQFPLSENKVKLPKIYDEYFKTPYQQTENLNKLPFGGGLDYFNGLTRNGTNGELKPQINTPRIHRNVHGNWKTLDSLFDFNNGYKATGFGMDLQEKGVPTSKPMGKYKQVANNDYIIELSPPMTEYQQLLKKQTPQPFEIPVFSNIQALNDSGFSNDNPDSINTLNKNFTNFPNMFNKSPLRLM